MSEKKKAPRAVGEFGDNQQHKGAGHINHDTPGSVNQEHADREHRKPTRDVIKFWGAPADE